MSKINKYIEALASEQQKQISYVKNMTAKINIPESAATTTVIKPTRHTVLSALCLIGGALTFAAGICLEKNSVSTIGGIAMACGAGVLVMDRKKTSEYVQREIAYYQVTRYYYKSLSDIYKSVTKNWSDVLTELKAELKTDIMQLSISDDKKNEAIQSILTTSVVDMSMTDLSKDLSVAERAKDEHEYERCAKAFEQKCIAAIEKAFEEQKAVYENLHI